MSDRTRRRSVVLIASGPGNERGWLALRASLALGLAGYDVTVVLEGRAVGWGAAELDAPWLGGDPRVDLAALIDELDGEVLAVDPPPELVLVRGCVAVPAGGQADRLQRADVMLCW